MLKQVPKVRWRSRRDVALRRARADAFRVYAIVLVVFGHAELLLGPSRFLSVTVAQYVLLVVARGAVPLFLFLAGNHLGPKLMRDREMRAAMPYLRRLAGLFVIGSLGYFILDVAKSARHASLSDAVWQRLAGHLSDPVGLVLHGTRAHLWFLPALMFATLFAATLLCRFRLRLVVGGAAALYVLVLLFVPYAPLWALETPRWGPDTLLQSPLFFVLGLVASIRWPYGVRPIYAWGLLIGGYMLHATEVLWLWTTYDADPVHLGMMAGTVPLTLGAGLLALHPSASRLDTLVAPLAPLVASVYLNHHAFLELLWPPRGTFEPWIHIVMPAAGLVLAFTLALFTRAAATYYRHWRRVRARSRRGVAPG